MSLVLIFITSVFSQVSIRLPDEGPRSCEAEISGGFGYKSGTIFGSVDRSKRDGDRLKCYLKDGSVRDNLKCSKCGRDKQGRCHMPNLDNTKEYLNKVIKGRETKRSKRKQKFTRPVTPRPRPEGKQKYGGDDVAISPPRPVGKKQEYGDEDSSDSEDADYYRFSKPMDVKWDCKKEAFKPREAECAFCDMEKDDDKPSFGCTMLVNAEDVQKRKEGKLANAFGGMIADAKNFVAGKTHCRLDAKTRGGAYKGKLMQLSDCNISPTCLAGDFNWSFIKNRWRKEAHFENAACVVCTLGSGAKAPTVNRPILGGSGNQRCGMSWDHANNNCGRPCPNNDDTECGDDKYNAPRSGMKCWSNLDARNCLNSPINLNAESGAAGMSILAVAAYIML